MSNRDDIHKVISEQLLKRQEEKKISIEPVVIAGSKSENNLDDLEKLKDLLDKGIITQDDFDAKKKAILNI